MDEVFVGLIILVLIVELLNAWKNFRDRRRRVEGFEAKAVLSYIRKQGLLKPDVPQRTLDYIDEVLKD